MDTVFVSPEELLLELLVAASLLVVVSSFGFSVSISKMEGSLVDDLVIFSKTMGVNGVDSVGEIIPPSPPL